MTPRQPDRLIGREQPVANAIDVRNVTLRRGPKQILHDFTWAVPTGACAAILGPNGSGKSTLTRILACHYWPTTGESRVLGAQFGDANLLELRKGIRLVQPAGPYDIDAELTAREVVLTGFFGTIGLYDAPSDPMRAEADRVLAQVGLAHVADHVYTTLSSGERIRALIGRALVREPRLLLLDEPTSGLDLLAREQVLATIQTMFETEPHPPTTVFITHHVEELPPATSHVLLLGDGRVVAAGTPEQVLRPDILSAAYGCPVEVRRSAGRYYVEVHPEAWRALLGAKNAEDRG